MLPLGMPGVLQAASPRFPSAESWKPRPGDGISPDWLIAELTHRQAHGLILQYRSLPRADTHVPLGLGALAPWGGGTTHEVLTAEGPILGPRQHRPWPWGFAPHWRTGRTDDMRSWSHRPRLCPPEATRGADGSRPPTSATIGGRDLRPRAATRGTTCNTLENKIPHSISPLHRISSAPGRRGTHCLSYRRGSHACLFHLIIFYATLMF